MEHFSHNHPLNLVEVEQQNKKYEDRKLICFGCRESISSENSAYCCSQYNCEGIFFLHKSCAELPLKISNPTHQQHSLILYQAPLYQSGSCRCNVCGKSDWKGFTYNCSLCEYDVDIKCFLKDDALMSTILIKDQILNHKSHKHPLMAKPRPALFFCNACGTEDKDESYSCTTSGCPFWIHRSCALLPEIKESKLHSHPLSLAFSFPSEYRHLLLNCDSCGSKLYLGYWVYQCTPCRYFLHVKCVDTKVGSTSNVGFQKEDKANNSIRLPGSDIFVLSNIFVGLTRDFPEKYGLAQQLSIEIKHFSHVHPLIFSIGHDQHDMKEMKYEEALICDSCILPICDSFYSCKKCNYLIHASCAQLPKEFEHPRHRKHPLVLRKLQKSFSYQKCTVCELKCNGFLYSCPVCNFHLDLKCAILDTVDVIMHEAHPHQLENNRQSKSARCNGCRKPIFDEGFGCEACRFYLHYNCILLPQHIKHVGSFRVYKWDNHPLTLMYPPFTEHPDEFYCEICEEEIHPKYWLYHCSKCDRSFHNYCLVELKRYRNIKFGTTLQVLNHMHEVKFIIRGGFTPFCECCDGDLYCEMAFECKDCDYYLCYLCAINSHYFGSDIFKSLLDEQEIIVAEDSNSGFEDEAKAHYSANLPANNIALQLARQFLRRHGLIESQLSAEINHFRHKHPLSLSTNHQEDDEEALICDGCIRPISDSYYCCNECNYFLHAHCAQMPYEIQHPTHSQHSLVLSKPLHYERCSFCFLRCNGFLYRCKEEFDVSFSLDVHCAMLHASSFILHETHRHQLVLTDKAKARYFVSGSKFACNACHENIFYYHNALSCEDCNFHLHYDCALLPRFARHVEDKHPLILILSCHSFSQHPKVVHCRFCKEKIYTIYWFYYCSECNQSFHPRCIPEAIDEFRNLEFGGILQVLNHPHPLKCVWKDAFHCDYCGILISYPVLAYGCEPCKYYNCIMCVKRSIGGNLWKEPPKKL